MSYYPLISMMPKATAFDPDAQAFITAASITDPTQQSAINQLVIDLKGHGIWTKFNAIYPMVGGTSTSTSYNLKNTAQYQISWSGGVTWGVNGVQFGGVNGYGNTGLNQSSVLSQNSQHISFYSRTNTDGNFSEIGLKSSGSAYTLIQTKYSNTFICAVNEFYNFADNSANTNGQGFYVGNRTGATVRNNWKNGSKVHTSSSASQTQANFNFFLGALNNAGTASAYSNKQCAFASIGSGLTDTEAANFYTAVQAFQVTLGRSIGTQTVSDADAQAFVTNAGIVDQVEANAINNLVIGLKADSLWTKMKAVYPMVGGSSSTMKYNLKNPLDTDAAFRLVFSGGWTFSSTGATPNGTNAYADTKLNANNILNLDSTHISYYSRTNSNGTEVEIGARDTSSKDLFLEIRTSGITYYFVNNGSPIATYADSDSRAFYIGNRILSNSYTGWRNSTKVVTQNTNSVGKPNLNMYLAALNNSSTTSFFTTKQCAFASIGDGLSDTDATNLNTRVNNFQVALSRNV